MFHVKQGVMNSDEKEYFTFLVTKLKNISFTRKTFLLLPRNSN